MSKPSVYTHCSVQNLGVHGCGVGVVSVADRSVAPPSGMRGMSIMHGRAWEDVYPKIRRVEEGVHGRSCSAEEVCVRIVDMIHARVLRSMY